jgi:hypothetical protein
MNSVVLLFFLLKYGRLVVIVNGAIIKGCFVWEKEEEKSDVKWTK